METIIEPLVYAPIIYMEIDPPVRRKTKKPKTIHMEIDTYIPPPSRLIRCPQTTNEIIDPLDF